MSTLESLEGLIHPIRNLAQCLTQAPWFGDALGSAVGLVAILVGALYNAKLNRDRDRELHEQEVASIRASLGTELRCYYKTLKERFDRLDDIRQIGVVPHDRTLRERLHIEPPVIYHSLAARVGVLPSDQASCVVHAWHMFAIAHNELRELAVHLDGTSAPIDDARLLASVDNGYTAARMCAEAADDLIGQETLTSRIGTKETAAATLCSSTPGRDLLTIYERDSVKILPPKSKSSPTSWWSRLTAWMGSRSAT